jgi:hypothetical protein
MSVQLAALSDALNGSSLKRIGPIRDSDAKWPFRASTHEVRRLRLNLNVYTPFLQLPPESKLLPLEEVIANLIEYSKKADGTIVFLSDTALPSVYDKELQDRSIAVLDQDLLQEFLETRDVSARYRILGSGLARSLGHSRLSPYLYGSPISGAGFFGRETLLGYILPGKGIRNTTIVGNRRIGKTSCLLEIRDRLKNIYDYPKTLRIAELYGSKCKSTWDAVYSIFDQVGLRIPNKWTKFGAIAPRYVLKMPQLLHDFARQNELQIVIFIDEYDDLLYRDSKNNYEFTHLLRETVMDRSNNCYVVIAGFRILMRERTLHASPLFNIAPGKELTPLSQQESMEMITEPLLRMGIDLPSELQGAIYRETRGQPELIQMYCSAAIELFHEKKRTPTPAELLRKVNGSSEFRSTILQSFFFNATAIEQIVCLELMKKAIVAQQDPRRYEFRRTDIEQTLSTYGSNLSNAFVEGIVSNLTTGSFLEENPPAVFRFATPQLVRFCERESIDVLLTRARNELGSTLPSADELIYDSHLPGRTQE